jgi:hypothetical protein
MKVAPSRFLLSAHAEHRVERGVIVKRDTPASESFGLQA